MVTGKFLRSSWDERTPPTTVLPSGLRLTGVEQWVKSLQAITGGPIVVKLTIPGKPAHQGRSPGIPALNPVELAVRPVLESRFVNMSRWMNVTEPCQYPSPLSLNRYFDILGFPVIASNDLTHCSMPGSLKPEGNTVVGGVRSSHHERIDS